MMVVLDASAILALLKREPGADVVASFLGVAMVCTPNITEVVTRLVDNRIPANEAAEQFSALSLIAISFDETLALRAGELRGPTAKRGLSLGGRACLALAERERVPAITADRVWRGLDIGIEIRLIR